MVIRIDGLGRLVIPKKMRESFHLTPGTRISVQETQEGLLLSVEEARCISCRSREELYCKNGVFLGRKCLKEFGPAGQQADVD